MLKYRYADENRPLMEIAVIQDRSNWGDVIISKSVEDNLCITQGDDCIFVDLDTLESFIKAVQEIKQRGVRA